MAKQQDGYEDMMSSIFDVLFAQAEKGKPPKPPRMTGLSGQSDLTRALAEVASSPAMYLKDGVFAPFEDAVNNLNLMDFRIDTVGGDEGRLRGRPTKELSKYWDNPDKFITDIAKAGKAERAWSKATYAGKGLDFVQSYAWAKKNKLNFKDAWNIGLSGSDTPGLAGEKSAVRMIAESTAIKALRGSGNLAAAKDIADLIRESNVPLTSPKALEKFLRKNNVSDANIGTVLKEFTGKDRDTTREAKIYTGMGGDDFRNVFARNLQNRESVETDPKKILELRKARAAVYTWGRLKGGIDPRKPKKMSNSFEGALKGIDSALKGLKGKTDSQSLRYLKELEGYKKEISGVQKELNTRQLKYENSGQFSTALGYTKGKDFKLSQTGFRSEIKSKIAILKQEGRGLERGDSNNKLRRREIALEIGMLREAEQNLKTSNIIGRDINIELGRWNKAFKEFNSEILQGGIVGKFVSGAGFQMTGADYFFSPSQRSFAVVSDLGGKTHKQLHGKFKGDDQNIAILTARTDINKHFAKLNALYYLTPTSIGKTLFYNGEWFYYKRHGNQRKAINALLSGKKPLFNQIKGLDAMSAFLKDGELDEGKILGNWAGFISTISGLPSSPELNAYVNKLMKANKVIAAFDKAGSFGSIIYRKVGFFKISERFNDLIAKGLEKSFLKKIPGMLGEGGFIGMFAKNDIGLAQLLGIAIKRALVAAGTAMGGVPGAIMEAMPQFILDGIANKMIIPIMKILSLIFWVLVLFFIGVFGLIVTGLNSLTTEHANVLPGEGVECVALNPYASTYPDGVDDIVSIGFAPPGSTCPILESMSCSQGPEGTYSHAAMQSKAIDVTTGAVWYAPTDGQVLSYSASNLCSDGKDYGGILWFQDSGGNAYRLIHVKALAGVGAVGKGQPVAAIRYDIDAGRCWTGAHWHLDLKVNGSWVNAEQWYREQLECDLSTCP